ncbi:cytochrome c-type heme lyase subunit nrfE [Vibrio ishigakensis]|uniref:Cytochrome c-type heme lyase subunit nrfE n=1 Tax=Vibrio ishigakensis TaxID=1481914 RepID=A0A0B8Q5Z1_9VIBR|nr:cytochrome c-type heme lyase subunit nrfE [Vibrio ishigakensis]
MLAWVFLTLGIAVGSWWAYYELGWGGWWFWDPVENASLMPWLTATALLHALVLSRTQKQMLFWSLSLAIVTFCLSILGTFIVRSGVLTSVHAFAVDPSKGLTLLGMLSLIFIASYTLLVVKSREIQSEDIKQLESKNSLVLVGVNILVVATLVVVFGTFYPMVYQLLGLGNISVGAPYFNLLFAPLALISLVLLGVMPFVKWQGQEGKPNWLECKLALFCGLVLSISLLNLYIHSNGEVGAEWSWWAFATLSLGLWVIIGHIWAVIRGGFSAKKLCVSLAHIGVAVACMGASMNSFYSYEKTVRLGPELSTQFGEFQLRYLDTELYIAPSFTAEQGQIEIISGSKSYLAKPEKRHYPVRVMNMTEPSMTSFWDGDIYITLGEKLDTQNYAVRVQFKAFVRWIGVGALLMVFAGSGLICIRLGRLIPLPRFKESLSQ